MGARSLLGSDRVVVWLVGVVHDSRVKRGLTCWVEDCGAIKRLKFSLLLTFCFEACIPNGNLSNLDNRGI